MKKLRPLIVKPRRNERDYMIVKCPLCEREFPMFPVSFSSTRKECPCGALVGWPNWTKEEKCLHNIK